MKKKRFLLKNSSIEREPVNIINQVAIITGASRGIGKEIALYLASAGVKVAISARNEESLLEVKEKIEKDGGDALIIKADLRDSEDILNIVKSTIKKFGKLDAMISCAGITHIRSIEEMSINEWDEIIAVNLTASFLCAKYSLKYMKKQSNGRIIFIGSDESIGGTAFMGGYAASKHGLIGLMRSLCMETAKMGITVNTICPGWTKTDMALSSSEEYRKLLGWSKKQLNESILDDTFYKGMADPKVIAKIISFLLTDDAKIINGQCLIINSKVF